jgi:hypothetical protein
MKNNLEKVIVKYISKGIYKGDAGFYFSGHEAFGGYYGKDDYIIEAANGNSNEVLKLIKLAMITNGYIATPIGYGK